MVSIVVPAYNCENTIENCLESILKQTYTDIEIIVIDDGSKDNTYNIVERIANKDNRIKIEKIANSGPSGARNAGIEKASGEYLAFVDADDTVSSEYIAIMMKHMIDNNADLVVCTMETITHDLKAVEQTKIEEQCIYNSKEEILDNLFELMNNSWFVNSLWCKLYKMSYIKENNIKMNTNLDMGEDFQYNIMYLEYTNKMVIIPDKLYKYYLVNSTLTYKYRPNLYEVRKESVDIFKEFINKYKLDDNIIHYLYIKLLFADCMQMWEYKEKYSRTDRHLRIKALCLNDEIINAKKNMKPQGVLQKVLYITIKTNNITIIDSVARMLSYIRKKNPTIKRASI